jgi:hypothetical protein
MRSGTQAWPGIRTIGRIALYELASIPVSFSLSAPARTLSWRQLHDAPRSAGDTESSAPFAPLTHHSVLRNGSPFQCW